MRPRPSTRSVRASVLSARSDRRGVAATLRALRPAASLLTGDVDAVDPAHPPFRCPMRTGRGLRTPSRPAAVRKPVLRDVPVLQRRLRVGYTVDRFSVNVPVEGSPMIVDLTTGAASAPPATSRGCDGASRGAADRQADADRLQRRRHGEVARVARGRQRRASDDGRGNHRAASAAAVRAGRGRRSLRGARADGTALPAHAHRSRLRRRHREPLLLVDRWRRVGGTVVLGERIAVRPKESAAVSAAAAGEGAVAAAPAPFQRRLSLPVRPAPRRSTVSTATSSSSTPSIRGDRSFAGRSGSIDERLRVCESGRADPLVGAGHLERGRSAVFAGGIDRWTPGVPDVEPFGQADRA